MNLYLVYNILWSVDNWSSDHCSLKSYAEYMETQGDWKKTVGHLHGYHFYLTYENDYITFNFKIPNGLYFFPYF